MRKVRIQRTKTGNGWTISRILRMLQALIVMAARMKKRMLMNSITRRDMR
jgi:hypothetical protein